MESNIIADSTITPFEKKGNTRNLENPSVQVLENKGRGYADTYRRKKVSAQKNCKISSTVKSKGV